ncbi:MAG TPA: VWA domain-containing protein [Chloroflexi bacterium]|nr:VWA domain-containing protein [Chloroflexota bacterium]
MYKNRMVKMIALGLIALVMLTAVACGPLLGGKEAASEEETRVEPEAGLAAGEENAEPPAVDAAPAEEAAPAPTMAAAPEVESAERAADEEYAPEAMVEAPGGAEGMAGEAEEAPAVLPSTDEGNPIVVPPDEEFQGSLSAGEIDDNEDFGAYLQYRRDFERFVGLEWVHDVDISERHTIRVRNRSGQPVLGAEVLVYADQNLVATLRTPATGIVRFFPYAYAHSDSQSYTVVIQKGGKNTRFTLTRDNSDATWDVTLDVPSTRPPINLDVLFLLDATGSMGDEIAQLKDNILSISAQIEALPGRPDVRYGMVTYRDRGDSYVTQVFDFTPDVRAFQEDLINVQAAGGGDEPESLNEALHRAIWDVSWRVDETVSLIFLVADAPPHLDYPQDYDYAQEMQAAAELGIKIHPIASSGLNSQGEYIFRQIAQFTGGHFIFLTYESQPQSSGEPGREDLSVPEGSYSVEDLDALVVRLIQEELAALTGQ